MKATGILFFLFSTFMAYGQTRLTVDVDNEIAEIQPTMYGVFFEDINFAADGGLYAEMVKNRSFEFRLGLMGWWEPNSDRHSFNNDFGKAQIKKQ